MECILVGKNPLEESMEDLEEGEKEMSMMAFTRQDLFQGLTEGNIHLRINNHHPEITLQRCRIRLRPPKDCDADCLQDQNKILGDSWPRLVWLGRLWHCGRHYKGLPNKNADF